LSIRFNLCDNCSATPPAPSGSSVAETRSYAIAGVRFESFRLGGRKISRLEDLPVHTAHCKEITKERSRHVSPRVHCLFHLGFAR
jgi:hypothetical protein